MVEYKYKLLYWPIRGRGEPIRMIFAFADVEFEDFIIKIEEWPEWKPKMPFAQCPVLEVNGEMIAQTTAIMRFLGHQFKMAGSTPVEDARLDMIAEHIQDMTNLWVNCKWGKVVLGWMEGDKDVYFNEKVKPVIEEFAPYVEKILADNGGNGLFMGDKVTWVDIFGAEMFILFIDFGQPNALDKYPLIKKMIDRVHNIPSIKHYCDNRPHMDF